MSEVESRASASVSGSASNVSNGTGNSKSKAKATAPVVGVPFMASVSGSIAFGEGLDCGFSVGDAKATSNAGFESMASEFEASASVEGV